MNSHFGIFLKSIANSVWSHFLGTYYNKWHKNRIFSSTFFYLIYLTGRIVWFCKTSGEKFRFYRKITEAYCRSIHTSLSGSLVNWPSNLRAVRLIGLNISSNFIDKFFHVFHKIIEIGHYGNTDNSTIKTHTVGILAWRILMAIIILFSFFNNFSNKNEKLYFNIYGFPICNRGFG